jgi:hypothetical protein
MLVLETTQSRLKEQVEPVFRPLTLLEKRVLQLLLRGHIFATLTGSSELQQPSKVFQA